jgi:hypothetical protein
MSAEKRQAALAEHCQTPIEGRSERIWTKNAFEDFHVYTVPTKLLVLNPENRRFRAEAQEVAQELGRELDPSDDESSIIALLLDKEPRVDGDTVVGTRNKDTEALIADWKRRRQERPLWIRPSGLVSNGNRRLAMLKRLQSEEGTDAYDWVDVVVMGDGYEDETLFEMEAREQLTEGFKVRYTKMNLLLTLRDAAERKEIKWNDRDSIQTTANRIQHLVGNNPSYAKVQLQAVKYMGDYLEWRQISGQYAALKNKVERFRDVGKNMDWVASHDPDREAAMLALCFEAIRSGSNHPDIRALRGLVQEDIEEFDRLVEEVEALAAESDGEEEASDEEGARPEIQDTDEESEREEEILTDAGPRSAKQKRIAQAVTSAAKAWRATNDPPETRVRTAANELASVDPAAVLAATSGVTREQVVKAIEALLSWSAQAEEALKASEQPEA